MQHRSPCACLLLTATSLPSTLMLFLVEPLTWRSCEGVDVSKALALVSNTSSSSSESDDRVRGGLAEAFLTANATCRPPQGVLTCQSVGGTCHTHVDGFYVEVGCCLLVGVVAYLVLLRRMARSLDRLPLSAYRCRKRSNSDATANPRA